MRIGIITFHWATNYGALLQTYALQTALQKMGHTVEIINYKPVKFDNNIYNFFRYRKFIHFHDFVEQFIKEQRLKQFRIRRLHLSKRFENEYDLGKANFDYDIVISGSDQVLNPSFLQFGEKGGSTAYFLGFKGNFKRIGYAVSFGTTVYPPTLVERVRAHIMKFSAISVREKTGIQILQSFGYEGACLVPDPTLLLTASEYLRLIPTHPKREEKYFVYILRSKGDFEKRIMMKSEKNKFFFSSRENIEDWLSNIYKSNGMITNSFHGVVFCLLFHISFIVVLDEVVNQGMNDRFFTLLKTCGLLHRIVSINDFDISLLEETIDWSLVDKRVNEFKTLGVEYLSRNIK